MEQQSDTQGLTQQDIEELETRAMTAEVRAASLEREVAELRNELVDKAQAMLALATAEVELATKDVEIARLSEGVATLAEEAGVRKVPNRVRRARGLRRIMPRTATNAEPKTLDGVAELGPLTVSEPALRWVGEIVEADK